MRSWSTTVTASAEAVCRLNTRCVSRSTFQTLTVLSAPPVAGLPLWCRSIDTTPDTCPNIVFKQRLVRRSQTFKDLSMDAVYKTLPSSSAATAVTGPKCPCKASLHVASAGARGSQRRIKRSTPAEMSSCRGSTRQTERTCWKWPPHSKRLKPPAYRVYFPVSTSHLTTRHSLPPVKAVLSSALRQTQVTALLCGFFRTMGLPRVTLSITVRARFDWSSVSRASCSCTSSCGFSSAPAPSRERYSFASRTRFSSAVSKKASSSSARAAAASPFAPSSEDTSSSDARSPSAAASTTADASLFFATFLALPPAPKPVAFFRRLSTIPQGWGVSFGTAWRAGARALARATAGAAGPWA
mmetsp:Transcript_96588/g.270380  ORF Transcript_96588/g.270380 Transcript_96588/m.270380 type:complete len:355 (+) Transcript_96588:490-1554(+)